MIACQEQGCGPLWGGDKRTSVENHPQDIEHSLFCGVIIQVYRARTGWSAALAVNNIEALILKSISILCLTIYDIITIKMFKRIHLDAIPSVLPSTQFICQYDTFRYFERRRCTLIKWGIYERLTRLWNKPEQYQSSKELCHGCVRRTLMHSSNDSLAVTPR